MKTIKAPYNSFLRSRWNLLLMAGLASASLFAEPESSGATVAAAPAVPASVPALPSGACPLNSGGPSLLGSHWRLLSVYGHPVPPELEITMGVEQTEMTGFGGCNTYAAHFEQVGNRGFKVIKMDQTRKACEVIRPAPGAPTINVGNWEGVYLRVLGRAGSVQQLSGTLQFYDFNGTPSIIFGKKYGAGEDIPSDGMGSSEAGDASATPAVTPATETAPASAGSS